MEYILNLRLSQKAADVLTALARKRNCSVTEIFRQGAGLVKLVTEAEELEDQVLRVGKNGVAKSEIVLPKSETGFLEPRWKECVVPEISGGTFVPQDVFDATIRNLDPDKG